MATQTPNLSANDSRLQMGDLSPRLFGLGLGVGVLGLGGALVLALMDSEHGWHHFFRAYLVGVLFVLSISLGAYFFTGIQHATRAGWSVVLRRLMEALAANLPIIGVLFIPIFLMVVLGKGDLLYHWVHPEGDDLLEHKEAYLNVPFWAVRAIAFFAIWTIFARLWYGCSVAQDSTGDVNLTHRMQFWAPLGILLYALTQTFAAFDWAMSLEAHWFSTMFGVYYFAISCCGFAATIVLLVYFLQRNGKLQNEVTLEHWQDMGKLLFAFGVVFHAYISFSQFMLIWYANIPEETTWFMVRMVGGWKNLYLLLAVGHFMIPFLLLVTKHTKRVKGVLASIAAWMLVMSALEIVLIVHPVVPAGLISQAEIVQFSQVSERYANDPATFGWSPGLIDLAALAGLVGLWLAFLARRLGSASLVPLQDPRIHESLAFENM